MSTAFTPLLKAMAAGALSPEDAERAFGLVLDGEATPAQSAAFLAFSGPASFAWDFLAAGARAMRARMVAVAAPPDAIDVCGTGGDGAGTLNVSTAVAFVVAACGIPVAKHGNRAATSKSGAADVLQALGLNLEADPARCFAAANLAFLFAPAHHPALRGLAPIRRELGFRTAFNVLGPLCNPAGVKRQLVGVADARLIAPAAQALAALGAERAYVIHGAGGLDEASPEGETAVTIIAAGAPPRNETLRAGAFGLAEAPIADLRGGEPGENAAALRALFSGQGVRAYHVAVVMNAALGVLAAGAERDPVAAAQRAEAAIASGAAMRALERLISASPP